MRPEDKERFLIFVDMLGFKNITNECKVRVQDHSPDEHGITGSGTTEMSNRVNRFNGVLDNSIREEYFRGGTQAMIFSDCAFLVFDYALGAAVAATEMMRLFIKKGVPVRMGLGKGTFYDLEYSMHTDRSHMTVTKSRFIGTAVVHAHAAEQCGGKGMRIFLHPSLDSELDAIRARVRLMKLAKPLKGVDYELDYLYDRKPAGHEPSEDDLDRELFKKVAWLKNPDWPRDTQRHYTQTLAALNRMRKANSRKPVSLRRLQYGGPVDIPW